MARHGIEQQRAQVAEQRRRLLRRGVLGNHQLRFTACTDATGPFTGDSFAQDIPCHVSSVPETSTLASMCLGLLAFGANGLRHRRGAMG